MQRLSVVLHGTLGSYHRDALHEGAAAAVACLHPCSEGFRVKCLFSFLLCWWIPLLSLYFKDYIGKFVFSESQEI
jgi:hypothetical protein